MLWKAISMQLAKKYPALRLGGLYQLKSYSFRERLHSCPAITFADTDGF
jgi:hypothetical protein